LLRYELWIEEALRQVIRRALQHAATDGLNDAHHFYITFRTDAEGVKIAPYLRAQHPDEMTIVLQHQFWDLQVADDAFAVTLKFRGKRECLRIPFSSVIQFADPSVNFGLQLKPQATSKADATARHPLLPATAEPTPPHRAKLGSEGSAPAAEVGKVITLDSFRKK
jgi:hypothetical protein